MPYCSICGKNDFGDHRCSLKAILRIEREYAEAEGLADDPEEEELSFDERIEEGFKPQLQFEGE